MSHVELYQLRGNARVSIKRLENMAADPSDPDQCRDVLRRLAKQHGIDPYAAELYVHEGRKKEYFRL